jgi:hypothetical protein
MVIDTQSQACSVGLPVAMQAIGEVCPVTTCQGSVVVNEFAARATPPPMRRISKRLPTPQKNCKNRKHTSQWRSMCVTQMEVQKVKAEKCKKFSECSCKFPKIR